MSQFNTENMLIALRTLQSAAVPTTAVDETESLRAEVAQLKVATVRLLKNSSNRRMCRQHWLQLKRPNSSSLYFPDHGCRLRELRQTRMQAHLEAQIEQVVVYFSMLLCLLP